MADNLTPRELVAHHEASHAVLAIQFGAGLSGGIDLDQPTSVQGAFGVAAINLWPVDPTQDFRQQQVDVLQNVAIICAGAASDAKLKGVSPLEALKSQPGDRQAAKRVIRDHPCVPDDEAAFVLEVGLNEAVKLLARGDVWRTVTKVAAACLANGGKLSKTRIVELAE